jgi:hypothetical protein
MQLAGFVYSSSPRKSRQQIGNRALALATEHGDAIRSGGHAHERPPSRHHRLLRSHAAERASSCHSPSSSCRPARTTACEYSQDDQTLLPRGSSLPFRGIVSSCNRTQIAQQTANRTVVGIPCVSTHRWTQSAVLCSTQIIC